MHLNAPDASRGLWFLQLAILWDQSILHWFRSYQQQEKQNP